MYKLVSKLLQQVYYTSFGPYLKYYLKSHYIKHLIPHLHHSTELTPSTLASECIDPHYTECIFHSTYLPRAPCRFLATLYC